jgi:bacteriocin-like protein
MSQEIDKNLEQKGSAELNEDELDEVSGGAFRSADGVRGHGADPMGEGHKGPDPMERLR